ncbi:MAG: LPS assembly protein LptD [Woeseiaceae bacterium]|nr:LPS assembly protein LptD [Woeseiaceae bacterium]
MITRTAAAASLCLAVATVRAAEPAACGAPPERLTDRRELASLAVDDPDAVVFEVGELEARLGAEPEARMSGGVILRQGDRAAGAENAHYDAGERALILDGNVRYEDPGTVISSDAAEFSYNLGRIRFEGAEFSLGSSNGRGAARVLEINERGTLELDRVSYTTCPPDSNDWLLEARDIELDTRDGVGTARGVKLRFQGVPILYAPYLSFPIGEARKSGLLTPEIGTASRNGNDLRIPYYWNIAPNYDATITPRLLTDRGTQVQAQFRYLTPRMNGQLMTEYLPNDSVFNDARHLFGVTHRALLGRWRNRVDFREVSDSQYFEDLGGSLSLSSITHLNRSVSFDYHSDTLSFLGRIQDYQTIDDAIEPDAEPYRRVPQFLLNGRWPDQLPGLNYALDAELVNFDRDVGVTGWRFNARPRAEVPIGGPGWFVTPAAEVDYTRYALGDTAAGQADDPSRTVPIGSVDLGLILERPVNGSRIQTLEPRLLYVHIPHREQSGLPVFDTITPDLNLVQLYRKNRFLGVDRIADTDQVSFGVTSRLLDLGNGRELLSATVGQTRYLSQSGVLLPGQEFIASESSDYIAEVRFLVYENLNFDVGHQWGTDGSGTARSEARLQYRPSGNKILNLAYRFRRDSLEQGDVSWSWPITSSWNFVGRYNFSFRDERALEQFFGLEYESCCWGLRLVSRRHISTRDGTEDSSFGLQLVLKGMTSVGTAADRLLERGILGYSADLR